MASQAGMWTGLSYVHFHRDGYEKTERESGGDLCTVFSAGATNVGDIVFCNASSLADKNTTAANYAGYIGVVVGGRATGFQPIHIPLTATTKVAACLAANQELLIQYSGIAVVWAGGTVTLGTNFTVVPDTSTAGQVIAGATAGTIVGVALTAGASGAPMKIRIINR